MNGADLPAGYVRCVELMIAVVRGFLADGRTPAFRWPPKGIMLAGGLDAGLSLVCKNDDARLLVHLCDVATTHEGTLFQLGVALDYCALEVERVPLEHFAQGNAILPLSRGGRA